MRLSVLLTALPLEFPEALRQVAALGFAYIDLVALADRPPEHLEALADSGLIVCGAALGHGLPPEQTLDVPARADRVAAVEALRLQIADAARLGATHTHLVSSTSSEPHSRIYFTEAVTQLADFAAKRMMQLCVEPLPGHTLSSAAQTLAWLREVQHPHLKLLLDAGGADTVAVVAAAGPLLGQVHINDDDMHDLTPLLAALGRLGYAGPLTLKFCRTDRARLSLRLDSLRSPL